MTKDYYRILGVLDDAEDIVIRAAYKALAQRYHPDKWMGSKEEANARMSDINEAYGILSDLVKRKKYDSSRDKNQYREEDNDLDSEDDDTASSIAKDWQEIIEYFPDLILLAKNLALISRQLDFTFKATLIEKKDFNNRKKLAVNLETTYLQKYFGKNPKMIEFAKQLIISGNKELAKKLNRAIDLLGTDVDPEIIINTINKSTNTYRDKTNFNDADWSQAQQYANQLINSPCFYYGKCMIIKLGGKASRPRINSDITVSYMQTEKIMHESEFVEFAVDIAHNLPQ